MGERDQKPIVILVVEDEAILRLCAVDMFEREGYEVLEAANADRALEILAARDDVCVLFTDINMPGSMDGLKLAAAVHDRWPPVHVIVTSGLVRPADGAIPAGGRFIAKPYGSAQLCAVARGMLH